MNRRTVTVHRFSCSPETIDEHDDDCLDERDDHDEKNIKVIAPVVIGKNRESKFGKSRHAEDKNQRKRKRPDFRVRKNHEEHDGGGEDGKVDEDVIEDIIMYIEKTDKDIDDYNH